jgi:hypothetical protein
MERRGERRRAGTDLIEGGLLSEKLSLLIDHSDDLIFFPSCSFTPKE